MPDSVPHPNGDGLEIVQRHAADFFTPKHSGFDTPIGATGFDSLDPGEFVHVPVLDLTFKDTNFPFDASPTPKNLAFGLQYEKTLLRTTDPTSIGEGATDSYATDAEVVAAVKIFDEIIARVLVVSNITVKFGLLELLRAGVDLAQQFADAGTSTPSSITIIKGTNTSIEADDLDFFANPNATDLAAMRAAGGPASDGTWKSIFAFFIASHTNGGTAIDNTNDTIEAFFNSLYGGVYETSPFVELVENQEYSGGSVGALFRLTNVPSTIKTPSFYTDMILLPANKHRLNRNILTGIMTSALRVSANGWGRPFDYRSNNPVLNFAVVASVGIGGLMTLTWDPPNSTPEYTQSDAIDAVYVASDPLMLAVNNHDVIPHSSGGFTNHRNASCAVRLTPNKSPFFYEAGSNGFKIGETVYFLVRTRSNPIASAWVEGNITDGEPSFIISAVRA